MIYKPSFGTYLNNVYCIFFLISSFGTQSKKGILFRKFKQRFTGLFLYSTYLRFIFSSTRRLREFFFSILSLAYFTLVFLDLQISRIYKRGLIWSDFQWFEKSLWSLKDSVFYEIGFRGLGQLFTLLILWGSTSFFLFESEKSVFIDPFYPFLRKTTGYSSPSLFSLKKEKPHIVVLLLESLGMRDLDSAPFFKKISNKGVFFDQFYANFPISCPAAVSTLFGIPPFQENFHYHSLKDLPLTGMPQMLKKLGYYTAHFTSTYGEAKKEYLGDGEVFDRYTNRVDYIEQAKGKFFFKAQERPWYKDTLFILLGDHGQPMGEHENLQIRMKATKKTCMSPAFF